jgi:hypothetical protein
MVTPAYYICDIDLSPRSPGMAQPNAIEITRPTKPFKG